jgi:heparin binding hemagglutinin HbhA
MTTTNTTTRKIPAPLYAAAGAGDLAYQRLRKLPEQVAQLRERVAEIAPAVGGAVSETNLRVDLDRLRDAARRNAATLVAGAQQASERAAAVYSELIVRGERVVRNVRTTEAAIEVAPAAGTVTTTTTEKRAATKKATAAKKAPAKRA